jgi:hypothetical protein
VGEKSGVSVAVGVIVGLGEGDGVDVGVIVSVGGNSVQVGGRTTRVLVGWRVEGDF